MPGIGAKHLSLIISFNPSILCLALQMRKLRHIGLIHKSTGYKERFEPGGLAPSMMPSIKYSD